MSTQQPLHETDSIIAPIEAASGLRVLVLVGGYLPGYKYGGPIRSVSNLVAAIGEEFHFRIVTLDRDLGDKLPFPGIVVNRWLRVGYAEVMYLRPGFPGLLGMSALLRSVDRDTVLYLNSFCSWRFSILALIMRWLKLCRLRCVVLAPHGEFSSGALKFKHRRKLFYLRIARWLGLYRGLIWHAHSVFEAADISRQFPLVRHIDVAGVTPDSKMKIGGVGTSAVVATTPDIASMPRPDAPNRQPKGRGQLRVVFLSRFSQMKNLAGALRMMQGVSGDVSFDLYGPVEDAEYWEECQGLIAELSANIRAQYWGEIAHEKVAQVFAEHDVLLLPTQGEAFGHVIGEALASGCPVLISDQTPWRNLETLGVGWDLPLCEPKRFRDALQQCVDMGSEEHAAMSRRAAAFGTSRANDPAVIEQNRALFRLALRMATLE